MINKNKVIVISNHHRRAPFFEDTMHRLNKDGYNRIVIQETGGKAWGLYRGPGEYIGNANISYDNGIVSFKKLLKVNNDELILLIDNDCFLSNTNHLNKYINDFLDGDYDFACHHIDIDCYNDYIFQGSIAPVYKQEFLPANIYPGFVPKPHWENSYLLIKGSMWNILTEDDVSHGRKYIKALVKNNAKLGAHRASYRLKYSHFGDEWFHVGNLMKYYYAIERCDCSVFNVDSELDMSRLGYFNAVIRANRHVCWFSSSTGNSLDIINTVVGNGNHKLGQKISLQAWDRLTDETCMKNWKEI